MQNVVPIEQYPSHPRWCVRGKWKHAILVRVTLTRLNLAAVTSWNAVAMWEITWHHILGAISILDSMSLLDWPLDIRKTDSPIEWKVELVTVSKLSSDLVNSPVGPYHFVPDPSFARVNLGAVQKIKIPLPLWRRNRSVCGQVGENEAMPLCWGGLEIFHFSRGAFVGIQW